MPQLIKSIMTDVTTSSSRSSSAERRTSWPQLPTLLNRARWGQPRARSSSPKSSPKSPSREGVKLVVTPIGPKTLPKKFQPYHTSVMVGDKEFSFGLSGICLCRGPQSHQCLPRSSETRTIDKGAAGDIDCYLLRRVLRPHYHQDSYDLLKKNCNNFSDVLLGILVDERLPKEYRFLEDLANNVDKNMFGIVRKLSANYVQNPLAAEYSSNDLILELKDRDFS